MMLDTDETRTCFADEIASDRARHPNWRYSGRAELLVAHGRWFERGIPPARRGGWYRGAKQCYRNAFLSVERTDQSRYVYVEGYCLSQSCFPHAWFVDRQ